ncbi:MAG: hemolysin family protein [Candidatus Latescibacteria bacterium]|jgi:CBS domain containing-hemolysin-like protein|nr:hemolysin family protein [Candidatus Latescibacterota bacterium]
MIELAIVVFVVILTSAMCSLFEAVLYSVPISHIETMAQDKKPSGLIMRQLRKNVDRPISAILSLNTISNTGGASLAGIIAGNLLGAESIAEYIFSAGFTVAILLFAEVIPKTVGVVYARPLSGLIARPLLILVWIFTPLIIMCRVATRLVAKEQKEQDISDEELISLARLGHRSGALDPTEAGVIQNILSLKTKTAGDVMTPRTVVFSLQDELTVEETRNQRSIWAYSRIPVYEKDYEDIVGIVLRRDVLAALTDDRGDSKLSDLMRPVHFVAESYTLDRILAMFLERRQHLFVVIDEYGGFAGVLALEDVLEEILGTEIVDESDRVEDLRELARRRRQQTLDN